MAYPSKGLFITGTDTDVGKTWVSSLIAAQLKREGHSVGVYKPVASGCIFDGQQIVSEDAVALWESAGRPMSLDMVCPQRFRAPVAPHLAAQAEGQRLDASLARSALEHWHDACDIMIVEGAGGLMSPLDDDEYIADLALDFGYPVVVVASNTVGAINQTLQTLITAECFRDGLPIAGVVINDLQAEGADPTMETNMQQIANRTDHRMIGRLRHHAEVMDPAVDWFAMAGGQ